MKNRLSFKKFDAELDTDVCDAYNNAELTLTMRIAFRRVDPAGGAQEGAYNDYGDATAPQRKIVRWTTGAWHQWTRRFVESAEAFWHGRFWLLNDSGVYAYKTASGTTLYPNVWCRFKLQGVDAPAAGAHHTIEVVRLHPSETWFGSHSTLYDSLDMALVRKAATSTNKPVMQRAHVHEIGHLLGLSHVDVGKPHCPASGNTNTAACYGVNDTDMLSVMGSGMQLRLEHAYPWRECMRHFAIQEAAKQSMLIPALSPVSLAVSIARLMEPVTLLTAVWPAATRRHYPRTQSEMNTGQQVTARPVRH